MENNLESTTDIVRSTPLARSLEMRAGFYQMLLNYVNQSTPPEINLEISRSFKQELASVLEGFVRMLRGEGSQPEIDPREIEIAELSKELADSKEKIITLLTEKAKEQAKIARLETELKFLPDLQAQADRALALVNGAGNLQEELIRLRSDLNTAHISRIRSKLHGHPRRQGFWSQVRSHLRIV